LVMAFSCLLVERLGAESVLDGKAVFDYFINEFLLFWSGFVVVCFGIWFRCTGTFLFRGKMPRPLLYFVFLLFHQGSHRKAIDEAVRPGSTDRNVCITLGKPVPEPGQDDAGGFAGVGGDVDEA